MDRKLIPMPIQRKDQEAHKWEAIIQRGLARYLEIAPPTRVTFFLNNIRAHARAKGKLLPLKGDQDE